jgi:hypothetical protein
VGSLTQDGEDGVRIVGRDDRAHASAVPQIRPFHDPAFTGTRSTARIVL